MKNHGKRIRSAVIGIVTLLLISSTGCYDQFDEFVMNRMGMETSEKEVIPPSAPKPKETPSEPEGPFLHEPTDKFNKVRFADEATDGIYPSDWVCYEKGCWWEMESDIDGKQICLTLYDPDGKALESIVPTYETIGNGSPEIMACKHLQGNKVISRWEKEYTYFGKMDYFREYDEKGMVYSVEYVYNEVVPDNDGWVTPYYELVKIVKTTYENGTVTDKTELPGKGMRDERARCVGLYDLYKITRFVFDP